MEFKMEPVKNQKFEIGRTINFTKCDCKECDFMHCPKNNYALKMQQHKYTIEEFAVENKDLIKQAGGLSKYLCSEDGLMDFIDNCAPKFPKGTYWQPTGYSIELVSQNRSKYGPDFNVRAEITFDSTCNFPYHYYYGCTDTQDKFTERLRVKFLKLREAYDKIVFGESIEG